MTSSRPSVGVDDRSHLRSRVEFLEELNRWHTHELESLASLGASYQRCPPSSDAAALVELTLPYLQRIAAFNSIGVLLTTEDQLAFELSLCDPPHRSMQVRKDRDALIESGRFAWALKQATPVLDAIGDRVRVLARIAVGKEVLGMLVAEVTSAELLPKRAQRLLSAMLSQLAYAIHNSALYQRLEEQNRYLEGMLEQRNQQLHHAITHDVLTNLPTRKQFQHEIHRDILRSQRLNGGVALILLDLDYFKRVNESFGHAVGDQILQKVARRLTANLRDYDALARLVGHQEQSCVCHLGGDEFGVLLTDEAADQMEPLLNRLIAALAHPVRVAGHRISLGFSAGIARFPQDADSAETLLQHAEIALHEAKRQGRNRHLSYHPAMKALSQTQMSLGSKLHEALDRNEFSLVFQPQLDVRTHNVIGLEALLRWTDEHGNRVPPDHFVPLAEETGQIIPIGNWVIREVCAVQSRLIAQGIQIPIAINISAVQFSHHGFTENLVSTMELHQIPAELIELELTESVLVRNVQQSLTLLADLRKRGLRISVDDFGTGYSSLSYLRQFKVDTLKIDRLFMQDADREPESGAIVAAIIAMGRSLGLKLIAEGVERGDQVRFLRDHECYGVQGFFYSEPLAEAQLFAYLNQYRMGEGHSTGDGMQLPSPGSGVPLSPPC